MQPFEISRWVRMGGVALALLLLSHSVEAQTLTPKVAPNSTASSKGKDLFESSCSVCHGMDGDGGEHAPGIGRTSRSRAMPDSELTRILHDGISSKGMPSFSTLGTLEIQSIVSYMRFLQANGEGRASTGDSKEGKKVFFGKGGCTGCHAMHGEGRFLATDLSDFAYDHDANDIRAAIINPQEQKASTLSLAHVTTSTGQQFSGVIRNENNSSIQIQDADGQFYLLLKSDLQSIERSRTLSMPVDFRQKLTAAEVEDLVSFIVQQSPVAKDPTSRSADRRKEDRID
ncbi:MAG: c-type cytochrome [Acidobacteria bacterium]|nr:c-type cytochrome [Acidobacteriota bacterium]